MFDFFRKKKTKVLSMNLHGNSIDVLETSLHFPLSLKDIETVFGKPDRFFKKEGQFIKYIYDELGFVFVHSFEIKQHLKSCEVYIDEEHLILLTRFIENIEVNLIKLFIFIWGLPY